MERQPFNPPPGLDAPVLRVLCHLQHLHVQTGKVVPSQETAEGQRQLVHGSAAGDGRQRGEENGKVRLG